MRTEQLDNATASRTVRDSSRSDRTSEWEKTSTAQPAAIAAQRLSGVLPVSPADILALQRSVGNRAVQALLARRTDDSRPRDANGVAAGAEAAVASAASSVGEALPEAVRNHLEDSLQADLSSVRIHTSSESAEAAHAVGATAFTVGQDIHFGSGRYAPAESAGLHLIAHEVAHTLQQRGSGPVLSAELKVSKPDDPAEVEAEKVADGIVSAEALGISDAPAAIHRYPVGRTPPATGAQAAPALGAVAPGATTSPGTSAAGVPSVTIGPYTVTTYDRLLAASRFLKFQLTTDAAEVPSGERSRTSADDLVEQEQELEPFFQSKGTAPLDQFAVSRATIWYQAYTETRRNLEMYKKGKAREDMKKAAAEVSQARDVLGQIPEQMAESQRRAFMAKDDELLEKITSTLGKALLVSSALLAIHEKCMEMVGWLNNETTHLDELVEKFGPFAEIAHKAVAGYEGLSSALTILHGGEGATEAERETSKASAGLGLAGAAGSLTGMASAYMVYFGVLLSAGQTCLKVVGVINREAGHQLNELSFAEGDLRNIVWSAEPGGRETYDFMVKVMHADNSTEIPTPIPEAVDKLIVERGEEFKAGTGEEPPIKGALFWKHTDPDKMKYWLMKSRNSIWNMLYGGNIRPPAAP